MRFVIINPDVENAKKLLDILKNEIAESRDFDETGVEYYLSVENIEEPMKYGKDLCVITEIDLLQKDGFALAEEIRALSEDTMLVFYTGVNDCAMQCYDLDLTYYLLKPVTKSAVKKMLKRIAARRESFQESDLRNREGDVE